MLDLRLLERRVRRPLARGQGTHPRALCGRKLIGFSRFLRGYVANVPDYFGRQATLVSVEHRRGQMSVLNRIRVIVGALLTPDEDRSRDTVAYHSLPNEQELRFSPINALRRYY